MTRSDWPAVIKEMIERAEHLTPTQADALGAAWTSEEGLTYDPASLFSSHAYLSEIPRIQNVALQKAWRRVSSIATEEGRADELDAAIAAEKAVERAIRFFNIGPLSKAGAVEAARAAVLAVGIRDIIEVNAYELLVGPWQQAFGHL